MAGSSGIGRGVTEVDDLAAALPMFLEGPVYDVYSQLSVEDKKSPTQLKKQLKAAFGVAPAQAFAMFKTRILVSDEAPDAFLAELCRLARTVCADGDEDTVNQFVVCQFVDGLPEPTRSQLRALKSGGRVGTDDSAKSMLQQQSLDTASNFLGQASGVGRGENSRNRPSGVGGPPANQTDRKVVHQAAEPRCYGCNRAGHIRRDCQVRCFLCNELGHVRRNWPNQIQGNDQRGTV